MTTTFLIEEYPRGCGLYPVTNFIRARLLPPFSTFVSRSSDAVSDGAPQYHKIDLPAEEPETKRCRTHRCEKFAVHGGGKRCKHAKCKSAAQSGGFCKVHSRGSPDMAKKVRRCGAPKCMKSVSQSGGLCFVHRGGKRCLRRECGRSARRNGYCIYHIYEVINA